MPRPQKPSLTPLILVILLLLIAVAGCALWYSQNHPNPPIAATSPSSPPFELISDDRIIYGGIPRPVPYAGPEVDFTLLKNRAYFSGYSESRKNPLWVAYRLWNIPEPFSFPRPRNFQEDERSFSKVKPADYTGSGYDRGHLAPNSGIMECFGRDAQYETFFMTNICPQAPNLNQKVWEHLEAAERHYGKTLEEVWIIDGPIFADLAGGTTNTLRSGVAVPSALFKILIDEFHGKPRVFAVIMPQTVTGSESPQQFTSTIDAIEAQTHLDFLWKLPSPEQEKLESEKTPIW